MLYSPETCGYSLDELNSWPDFDGASMCVARCAARSAPVTPATSDSGAPLESNLSGNSSDDRSSANSTPDYRSMDSVKRRRKRTYFDDAALDLLERQFNSEDKYPDISRRQQLARQLGVDEARIQVWFQNKRSRSRRMDAAGQRDVAGDKPNRAGERKARQQALATAATPLANVVTATATQSRAHAASIPFSAANSASPAAPYCAPVSHSASTQNGAACQHGLAFMPSSYQSVAAVSALADWSAPDTVWQDYVSMSPCNTGVTYGSMGHSSATYLPNHHASHNYSPPEMARHSPPIRALAQLAPTPSPDSSCASTFPGPLHDTEGDLNNLQPSLWVADGIVMQHLMEDIDFDAF